jgi:hypothetical protein
LTAATPLANLLKGGTPKTCYLQSEITPGIHIAAMDYPQLVNKGVSHANEAR